MSQEQLPGIDWEASIERPNPNAANMDSPYTPNFPYRIATEIENHIVGRARHEEYYVGQAERDDWAKEYVLHLLDQNAIEPEYIAWQGLQVWRASYYRGRHG